MSKHKQIVSAVAAHAAWKTRLGQGIASRKFDVSSSDAKRDDLCEFGQWLKGSASSSYRESPHFKHALELHARFHAAVGGVVAEVERGRLESAKKQLESEVLKASTDLTRLMMTWQKEPD